MERKSSKLDLHGATLPLSGGGIQGSSSSGTMAASFELRSVSEVLMLRTCGAAVNSYTKA